MSILDVEKIINGTPIKRLNNGYNKMKENYTNENAQEYYDIYSKEPLSFLLENSGMIFSEPYYGTAYYESVMKSDSCCFNALERENEKVLTFLEECGDQMPSKQKEMYDNLASSIQSLMEHTKNTQIYASYIKENVDDNFEDELSSLLFSYESADELQTLMESIENPVVYFTYAPYVVEKMDTTTFNRLTKSFCEKASVPSSIYDEEQWKTFVETVICCNKLKQDNAYMEKVREIPNRSTRAIFEYFMNTSLADKLIELVEERSDADVHYSSRVSAINNIFMDMYEATIDAEENNRHKEQLDRCKGIAYESTLDIIVTEYQKADDTVDLAKGYSLLTTEMSLDDAFGTINSLYQSTNVYVQEADDDVSDDDIDAMDKEVNDEDDDGEDEKKSQDVKSKDSKKSLQTSTDNEESNNENDDVKDREIGGSVDGKKPQAPKPKNLANAIQFKAMDKEAKRNKKKAIREQRGQEIKNAVKSVMAIPMNVINSVKGQIKQLDAADDMRRKSYMTEPGFRKKAFRNLKVAIMYGTAAQIKLSLVPVTAVCRHFSKNKDRRMRNELIRELNTEIKVCEEKINDANAREDRQEKYRLIRIKDQLDAEMIRVKTNSKYI